MKAQLTRPQWLSLPIEVRNKLVLLFAIPRSGFTEVQDSTVVSDGYTHEDLTHITVEKMQVLLDSDEKDFFALFEEIIINTQASLDLPKEEDADLPEDEETPKPTEEKVVEAKPKRTYARKTKEQK